MPKTRTETVSSIVITGRSMNGRERPEENWVSFCAVPPAFFTGD